MLYSSAIYRAMALLANTSLSAIAAKSVNGTGFALPKIIRIAGCTSAPSAFCHYYILNAAVKPTARTAAISSDSAIAAARVTSQAISITLTRSFAPCSSGSAFAAVPAVRAYYYMNTPALMIKTAV
jgi:hypothetical protein